MMPKSLREVMQDTPEAYVKRAEIVVKIKEAVTENRFNVEDDSLSIFGIGTWNWNLELELGIITVVYCVFNVN